MIAGLVWDGTRWLPLATYVRQNRLAERSREARR